ncbi:glycoside hydrolase family 2 TIM barrel-domain containing protein [Porifericola rhodea]|uniref:glycoside hydrolase family 2 protein n=1 Tax=Porifericola rhodea TaxID=930972 RepID=UPI0026658C14|nr:sugar-binding domain-containing protein [Porifericola rhodea]WKN30929.1 glycoside hydrolase family 2 TIM barrel-domain containing protein [Porifericola rhodea]
MKQIVSILMIVSLFFCGEGYAQNDQWKMADSKISTRWAANVSPENVHQEYPRPQMRRDNWQNLNGLWQYSIQEKAKGKPVAFQGEILVPFPAESALSGVGKRVGEENELWYKTNFSLDRKLRRKNILLHFGAVDWEAEVFVNGKSIGTHRGGYDPFSFDITEALTSRGEQELVVRVWDPSDNGPQPRGKQVKDPHGIWYTPVTGIWQTVWLEAVPESYIEFTRNTPDFDKATFNIGAGVANARNNDQLRVRLIDGETQIAEVTVSATEEAALKLDQPKLWTPESPFLYDIEVTLLRNGKVLDEVQTYSAMRKISMEADDEGIQRMMLNNEFVFQYGPLDQGWWPDGLYTAPTDEALRYDIEKTQEMGFNMIRKHVKVEPARWYYYCDQMGMLVWQDMPSGDMGNRWNPRPGVAGIGTEKERTSKSEEIFRTEWKEIMDDFYNFPSIVVWVPFNEAWGQFKTVEITEWTMNYDPSRLVNSASGGNFYPVGHIIDLHNYPDPAMPDPTLFGEKQILVLGEYGGLGLPVENHTWQEKDNWGYQSFKNKEELSARYQKLMEDLVPLIPMGLSAAIYTQTSDVEVETNGLMTYDRKVIKFDEAQMKQWHQRLYNALK